VAKNGLLQAGVKKCSGSWRLAGAATMGRRAHCCRQQQEAVSA
jgi:hypothetical protein